jgi:hypothetical protein
MSYDLCIWDPVRHGPLPATEDEAQETMERLSRATDWLGSSFEDFGGLLVALYDADASAQFNANSQNEAAAPAAEDFWRGDPQKAGAACKLAVFRLSIAEEPNIRQIAYAVLAAAELGLVVYDDENGMCFLPDGRVLPPQMQEGWEADLAELKAGPEDSKNIKPDNRTLLQTIAMELFEAIGRGNKRL